MAKYTMLEQICTNGNILISLMSNNKQQEGESSSHLVVTTGIDGITIKIDRNMFELKNNRLEFINGIGHIALTEHEFNALSTWFNPYTEQGA